MKIEEFAAKRREILTVADDLLRDAVEDGLQAHLNGDMSWTSLLAAASKVWLENFQAESPGASYSRALARFQKDLGDALAKTSTPATLTEGQVERITRWASTYAVNSGTMTGTYARGGRYKVWVDMDDGSVRASHALVDGQIRPIGGTWSVAGTKVGFPGEPVGPPEVWINCRCVAMPAAREGEFMTANTFALGPEDDVEDENPDVILSGNITAAGGWGAPSETDYAVDAPEVSADGTPYTQAVIVLIPTDSDPITAASSESAHVTTVFLGEVADLSVDMEELEQTVRLYAQDLDGPVIAPVRERGTLGDDDADVVFLETTDALVALRDGLLANEQIRSAYEAAEQFPEWTPHVTLGYPERPAKGEYDATEVTFDRIGLWLAGEHYDYPMGGAVTASAAFEMAEVIADEEVAPQSGAEDAPEDFDDDEPLETLIPIHGVLAPEGILSGDGRGFREGAVTSRKLPLHYRYEFVGSHGGNQTSQAVTVGTINEVWRHTDGMNRFRGYLDMSRPYADQALADILQGIGFNSIDADAMEQDVSMYFDADGNMIDQPAPTAETAGKQPETWYSAVRVAGLTQVPVQAFPETYTALGHEFEEDMTEEALVAAGKILEDCGCSGTLALEDVGTFAPGTKDGPGWITHPNATRRIRNYWTKGEGAAKIAWGTPGDFNRCRAQLAKYVQNPEWLAGLCANMHYEVLKTWPGPKRGDKGRHAGETDTFMRLVASGGRVYSSMAFKEPTEPRAFAMRIDREARTITGYAAQWGVCHIGIMGMCKEPPRSRTNYSYFRKGIVETDAGEQSVATITFGHGHASQFASAAQATAHYDDPKAVRAYINIGENAYGIWYSGVLAPWVTDDDIDAMLAIRRVSGDWRNWSGRRDDLEMVGLTVVAVDGYQLAASGAMDGMIGGVQTAAIGLGAIDPYEEAALVASGEAPDTESNQAFLAGAVVMALDMIEERKRAAEVRERVHKFRLAEARRRLEGIH